MEMGIMRKIAGKLFLIVFWTVIWGVLLVPFLIGGALFWVLDFVFWHLESMQRHCIDEVKRLVGEWGWFEEEDELGEDERRALLDDAARMAQELAQNVERIADKIENVKARARHRATIAMLKHGRGEVDKEDNEDGN